MQKIIPHLWFDTQAVEAAEFYTKIFPDSKITHKNILKNTPSGDCDVVSFDLSGFSFMAISAGPYFKLNPSISFMVNFDPSKDSHAEENLEKMWKELAQDGTALMELGEYPFSKKYGWIQDKYGVSWQLILTDAKGEERPFITPSLLFVGDVAGKATKAVDFYLTVFKNAKLGTRVPYGKGHEGEDENNVMFSDFTLEGQWFTAMDSSHPGHKFGFGEALSLLINCKNQEEIDYYWEKLSAVPEAEQCGWLKDKFGVSWQVSPTEMNEMMEKGSEEQIERVTQAFLKMKKFDLAKLQEVYNA
jgi:predicted 3-demethylubiquinone-9 3-methyltransferase (glyoxalase superfamily)